MSEGVIMSNVPGVRAFLRSTTLPAATTIPTMAIFKPFRTDFVTLGTRLKADPKKLHGWEYEGEFAFQTGQVSDLDLTAFTTHVGGGYNVKCPWSPRLFAEYNFASGDHNPHDGNIQTFQNRFRDPRHAVES